MRDSTATLRNARSARANLNTGLLLALGACVACGPSSNALPTYMRALRSDDGHHEPADAGNADSADSASNPPDPTVHFDDVYSIIAGACGGGSSGCHIGAAPAMLAMPDPDSAYSNLVGVASSKCQGALRVVPGDPAASVLIATLEGTSSCVQPMPRGRDPLPEAQIEIIRAWITAGAPRD